MRVRHRADSLARKVNAGTRGAVPGRSWVGYRQARCFGGRPQAGGGGSRAVEGGVMA
jgi:hypothetical protein